MTIFAGLLEVTLIGSLAALACSLVGPVLLLRKRVLLGDAVSHSLLAGIGVAYLIHPVLDSPWLRVGAAVSGCLAAWSASQLTQVLRGRADAALGLVFPFFFSIGALILALAASDSHLDVDQVLSGNLEASWLERTRFMGIDFGPTASWNLGLAVIVIATLGWLGWRDLQLHLFDPQQGQVLGRPMWLVEILVVLSATTVIVLAFDAMGPILVVTLLAGPGICAWLITKRLPTFFLASVIAGQISVVTGVGMAGTLDLNLAGSIGLMAVTLAAAVLAFAPYNGIFPKLISAKQARTRFVARLLLVHVRQHEIKGDHSIENSLESLCTHLGLSSKDVLSGANWLTTRYFAEWNAQNLATTQAGINLAKLVVEGAEIGHFNQLFQTQRPASLM